MEVVFDQDGLEGEKQGYGRLELTLDDNDDFSFSQDDSIIIGRYQGSSLEFLLPDGRGWDGVARALHLASEPEIGDRSAVFLLQPAYVNKIDEGPHEVRLVGADNALKGQGSVFIDYVIHQDIPGKDVIINYREEAAKPVRKKRRTVEIPGGVSAKQAAPQETAAETPETPPNETMAVASAAAFPEKNVSPDENLGGEGVPAAEAGETGRVGLAMEPALEGDGKDFTPAAERIPSANQFGQPLQQPYPMPRKSAGKMWLIILLCVIPLLAAGGAAAWYFLMYKPAHQAEELEAAREEKTAPGETAQPEPSAPPAESKDAQTRVREFFAGQRDPAAAMALADELPKESSAEKDAVFRLYYYAAEQGNPRGVMRYAETIDPTLPAWGTVKKDGAEAWRYYGQAPEGAEARARLKAWTEEQAGTGNTAARDWLRQMN